MAKWETVLDDFPGVALGAAWNGYGTRSVSAGKLRFPITGANFAGATDFGNDLTGSYAMVKVEPGATGYAELAIYESGTYRARIQKTDGANTISFRVGATTYSTVTYSAADMGFWRIRESGGSTHLETSPHGAGAWTTWVSQPNAGALTNCDVDLAAGGGSATSEAAFSKFNIVTVFPKLHTLRDNFPGPSNSAVWSGTSGTTPQYLGGTPNRLAFDVWQNDGQIRGVLADITESAAFIRAYPSDYGYLEFQVCQTSSTIIIGSAYVVGGSGNLVIYYNGGVRRTLAYDPVAHAFWKWAATADGTLWFQTSPTGREGSWTTLWVDSSAGATFSLTSVLLLLNGGKSVGAAAPFSQYAYVGKLNIPSPGAVVPALPRRAFPSRPGVSIGAQGNRYWGISAELLSDGGAITSGTGVSIRVVTGQAAADLGALTATAAGSPGVEATAATATLGALIATADGSPSAVQVTGVAAADLGALVASSTGGPVTILILGTAAADLGALTATAAGAPAAVEVTGAASATLGALSAVAAGTPSTVEVSGSAAATLGALVGTAAGAPSAAQVTGTAQALLGGLTATAAGAPSAVQVDGAATASLGGLTATAAGAPISVQVLGTAAATLGALTASASGAPSAVRVDGTASATLGGLTATATGVVTAVQVTGVAAATLGALGATAVGYPGREGVATAVFGALTATAIGQRGVLGQVTVVLGGVIAVAIGGPLTVRRFKVWNGTEWVSAEAKVWDGDEWVTTHPRAWVGAAWD